MIKVYLKQAWELLKQNKLFSMLYIVGTGLAIAMTMIMAVVYYVKIAPVYPEANRMNTLYLSNSKFTQGSGNNTRTMQWAVSYKALQDWFYPVENALVVSAELHNDLSENSYIQPADRSGDFPVMVKLTDPAFFKIYSFQFLEGSPFIGMHKILLAADFLYLSPQSISLLTVLHQKGSTESSQIGKVVLGSAVIGRHRIRYIKLCIGFRGEVTGTAHHPTNPIVDIVQAERASYYLFRRTEQAACQIIGNDSSGNATCQVGCREWTTFQEL